MVEAHAPQVIQVVHARLFECTDSQSADRPASRSSTGRRDTGQIIITSQSSTERGLVLSVRARSRCVVPERQVFQRPLSDRMKRGRGHRWR
jgi:hypothetical protein